MSVATKEALGAEAGAGILGYSSKHWVAYLGPGCLLVLRVNGRFAGDGTCSHSNGGSMADGRGVLLANVTRISIVRFFAHEHGKMVGALARDCDFLIIV